MEKQPLVQAVNLKMYFKSHAGAKLLSNKMSFVKAVDDVSFSIEKGETFGMVGESGCGKTTVGRVLCRLYEPTDGQVCYDNIDISHLNNNEILPLRNKIQMIFQDPYASLDPRMTIGDTIAEPLMTNKSFSVADRKNRVKELIELVGLKNDHINRYPHEFSGGQRQRIGIARALANSPEFIICDEPISALDVSIQAQVVNMLEELQEKLNLTYLFISHDLSMVKHISRRVGVMYLGHLVECAGVKELYSNMQHPYTKALLSAVPVADPKRAAQLSRIVLKGDVPSPINPPSGCPFRTRCAYAQEICALERPELRDIGSGHSVACHVV